MPWKFQLSRKKKWLEKRKLRDETVGGLELLLSNITVPNSCWSNQSSPSQLRLCKIQSQPHTSSVEDPLSVHVSLLVNEDLSWTVFVQGKQVEQSNTPLLSTIPANLDGSSCTQLLTLLDTALLCPGHPDPRYMEMAEHRKGTFIGQDGRVRATLDKRHIIDSSGKIYSSTIRTTACEFLTDGSVCHSCMAFGSTLRSMYYRWSTRTEETSKYTNNRYLSSPEKVSKIKDLQDKVVNAEKEIAKLKELLKDATEKDGITVDGPLHDDLLSIMKESTPRIREQFAKGTFRRLFWDQQLQSAEVADPRLMRWHPTMIRWCLNLKLLSSAAYHCLRTSGFVKLPSERTLRDYTHFFQSKTGFQPEVEAMLKRELKLETADPSDLRRYVVLLTDEIKIKESLVYEKHSCRVIGFTELDDVDDYVKRLEQFNAGNECPPRAIATHVLTVMVRGIFTSCCFPLAHFPTSSLSGDQLALVLWKAVERLERIKLKVVGVTADGAGPNRKFFHLHSAVGEKCTYKTKNHYTQEDRPIYFFCDVPHLMKTTRNCWSHSSDDGSRRMWVLSNSVATAFSFYSDPATSETEKFVLMMDKFFDCLNVRSPDEHQRRCKPNLRPYRELNDSRFKWLEEEFLGYLDAWEVSVKNRKDVSDAAKKEKMLLSRETREGLRVTVKSFVELSKYLMKLPAFQGKYLLSEHFSQDPIENYFGQLRSHGGWCKNPTIQSCISAAQSIRVQGSLAMVPYRGNSSRKQRLCSQSEGDKIDDTPLQKHKRK